MRRWIFAAIMAAAAVLTVPDSTRAGLIPVQVSVTPDGGNYRYTYAILLPTDSVLRPGDYFTIYDFDGFVPDSNMVSGAPQAADWSFAANLTGSTPSGVTPTDNPGITNLTWQYNGATINLDASLGSQGLGNFWAYSVYPDTTDSWFTASTGTTTGETDDNITPTTVPVPTGPGEAPPGVPEPTTLLLAGLGLPIVAVFRRRGTAK